MASSVSPEGMTTGYSYDSETGDLLSVTVDQGGKNLETSFSFDTVGNVVQETNPLDHTTTYEYDSLRRLVQATTPAPFNYVTRFTYDEDGNLITLQRETGDPTDPWQERSFTYTLTGYQETREDPAGHVSTFQYDVADRLWKINDAEARTTEFQYDAVGRFYRVIDPLGNVREEYAYTPNGRIATFTDANGNTTRYEYDGFDRLHKSIFPDDTYTALTYDAAGTLTEKRTRSGDVIEYSNDELRRMIAKSLPSSGTMEYGHDLEGRLTDATDQDGTIRIDRDTAGRLARVTYPDGKAVQYAHDAAGNRTGLTYPDGYTLTYSYDSLNRLTEILEGEATSLVQYEYDALGRRTAKAYANGTRVDFDYDIDDTLVTIAHQFNGGSAAFTYTYDDTGERTGVTVDDDRYVFNDLAGMDGEVAFQSNNLNQYTTVGGKSFTYDANGNLLSDGVNSYAYDAENRLVAAANRNTSYTYDPFGRRSGRTVDGVDTSYLHDGDRVLVEYDDAGQLRRRYVYGPWIDEPLYASDGSAEYFYHADGLGSVVALTDAFGDVLERYAYSPFGRVSEPSSEGNPYLFTAREYEAHTGLYYYRARYYDPELGRFLQPDPIGYTAGPNLYAYCRNNPTNLVDPTGEFIPIVTGLWGGAIGAVIGGVTAAATGGDLDAVLAGAAGGFTGGFIAGSGAGLIAAAGSAATALIATAGVGAVGAAVGNATSQVVTGVVKRGETWGQAVSNVNLQEVGISAALGGVMGVAAGRISAAVQLSPAPVQRGVISNMLPRPNIPQVMPNSAIPGPPALITPRAPTAIRAAAQAIAQKVTDWVLPAVENVIQPEVVDAFRPLAPAKPVKSR